MSQELQLTQIWKDATWGAGYVGDAIKARRENPSQDVLKELGESLVLLDKATAAIQQILASSYYNRQVASTPKQS